MEQNETNACRGDRFKNTTDEAGNALRKYWRIKNEIFSNKERMGKTNLEKRGVKRAFHHNAIELVQILLQNDDFKESFQILVKRCQIGFKHPVSIL
jgi:hypothetical protein